MTKNADNLAKLVTYIEENLRASKSSGLHFVDPRHFRDRLVSNQNHIVFGRRGAGKSTLISSLRTSKDKIIVELNLEDYKDITFPNIIIHVLVELLKQLEHAIVGHYPWYRPRPVAYKLQKRIKEQTQDLLKQIEEPDEQEQQVKTKSTSKMGGGVKTGADVVDISYDASKGKEIEISSSRSLKKLDFLRNHLTDYKESVTRCSALCSNKPIFLIMDDFYFVPKSIQPELIDYFHRLTKGSKPYQRF